MLSYINILLSESFLILGGNSCDVTYFEKYSIFDEPLITELSFQTYYSIISKSIRECCDCLQENVLLPQNEKVSTIFFSTSVSKMVAYDIDRKYLKTF